MFFGFSENACIVVQSKDNSIEEILDYKKVNYYKIGSVTTERNLLLKNHSDSYEINIQEYRDYWGVGAKAGIFYVGAEFEIHPIEIL